MRTCALPVQPTSAPRNSSTLLHDLHPILPEHRVRVGASLLHAAPGPPPSRSPPPLRSGHRPSRGLRTRSQSRMRSANLCASGSPHLRTTQLINLCSTVVTPRPEQRVRARAARAKPRVRLAAATGYVRAVRRPTWARRVELPPTSAQWNQPRLHADSGNAQRESVAVEREGDGLFGTGHRGRDGAADRAAAD
jgi:hypothetical protein